ncbi:angiopoietin-4-like [Pecten maximus]|uniref:angiopoietin-4-like n=1 Tax=Pecten maximus TaxID=6579 RepID=UPI00145916E5|nr:angiopoietin-4-like [Pecten maximus]
MNVAAFNSCFNLLGIVSLSWTTWGAWSSCSTTCGNHGNQVRNRSCTNTKGDLFAVGCDGISRDERNCSGGVCIGCAELYNNGEHVSGVYTIAPTGHRPLNVHCDMTDGGGWTVIQHRIDGAVSFNRNWTDYVTGFGDLRNDFWLGLEYIHTLTSLGAQVIIDMITTQGELIRYSYGYFKVKNSSTFYELSVSNDTSLKCSSQYRLLYNDGAKFTTPDRIGRYGCALSGSGWWFNGCSYFNPNGLFGLADVNYGMAVYCNSKDVVLNETVIKVR